MIMFSDIVNCICFLFDKEMIINGLAYWRLHQTSAMPLSPTKTRVWYFCRSRNALLMNNDIIAYSIFQQLAHPKVNKKVKTEIFSGNNN